MQLSRLAIVALLISSALFAGCAGTDSGDGDASPTPTGGMNQTAPKAKEITITAHDTPGAGDTRLMKFVVTGGTSFKMNDTLNITFKTAPMQRGSHNLRVVDHPSASADAVGVQAKVVQLTFGKAGSFKFYCNIQGSAGQAQTSHESLGMTGTFMVS